MEPDSGYVVKYKKFWNIIRTHVFNNVFRNFVGIHYYLSVPLFASFFPWFWNKRNDQAQKMDTQENLVPETENFVTNKKKRLKSDLAVCSPTDELFVPSFFWPFVKRLVPTRTPCTQMSPGDTFYFYFLCPKLFLYNFGEISFHWALRCLLGISLFPSGLKTFPANAPSNVV